MAAMLGALAATSLHLRRHCEHRMIKPGCEACELRRVILSVADEYEDWREATLLLLARLDDTARTLRRRIESGDHCSGCDDHEAVAGNRGRIPATCEERTGD